MENIITFFTEHLDYLLLSLIILSGLFVTKYSKGIESIADVYKVLIASVIISIILYFIEDCAKDCLPRYLFTYFFATSFYELIVKFIVNKVSAYIKNKEE